MTTGADRHVPSGTTYHLAPATVWEAQAGGATYEPEAFAADGFVHCTDGLDHLLVPANAYYQGDPRPYVALVVDLAVVSAPARYDDEACAYPHIYGPIDVAAVTEVLRADRDPDGRFTGFTP